MTMQMKYKKWDDTYQPWSDTIIPAPRKKKDVFECQICGALVENRIKHHNWHKGD